MNWHTFFTEACSHEQTLLLGVVTASVDSTAVAAFQTWLAAKKHGAMRYMEQHLEARENPELVLDGVRTVVSFALNYGELAHDDQPEPRIAAYARMRDYHKLLREAGERVALVFTHQYETLHGQRPEARVIVDTAPFFERAAAAKTARGFIGKNTMYIHPQYGSFLLLGEILLDVALPVDGPNTVDHRVRSKESGGCGPCKRCQVHCPTGALDQDYQIDARRCLSYWTIEHRGAVPTEYWPHFAKYWYGCDICQNVCPYNRTTVPSIASAWKRNLPQDLAAVATMTEEQYLEWFAGTPMTRAKKSGLQRNALIALVVNQDHRVPEVVKALQQDESPTIMATLEQLKNGYP